MNRGLSDRAHQLRDELDRKLQELDRSGAISTAVCAVRAGSIGLVELYEQVLGPLMVDTGARWQSGETEVWQEHLASAVMRGIVESLSDEVSKIKALVPRNGRAVLLACPREEQHDLGPRMLADRFETAGWTAYFLGADVPKDQIIAAAKKLEVDALVLSAATHFHRLRLRELVDNLHHHLPGIDIWVEGAAFRHDHDGWKDEELLDVGALLGRGGAGADA